MKALGLLLGGLLFLVINPVQGADLQKGMAAGACGDYATALAEFRPLAAQGNAEAEYELGLMYDLGLGVPHDYAQALTWYRKSAAQGNSSAQVNLGVMYNHGRGVPQDYAQALAWLRKSAAQGNAVGIRQFRS